MVGDVAVPVDAGSVDGPLLCSRPRRCSSIVGVYSRKCCLKRPDNYLNAGPQPWRGEGRPGFVHVSIQNVELPLSAVAAIDRLSTHGMLFRPRTTTGSLTGGGEPGDAHTRVRAEKADGPLGRERRSERRVMGWKVIVCSSGETVVAAAVVAAAAAAAAATGGVALVAVAVQLWRWRWRVWSAPAGVSQRWWCHARRAA